MNISSIDTFHGPLNSSQKTYAEYGDETIDGKKIPIRTVYGQDGYDLWHLGVRFKELINLKNLLAKDGPLSFEELPRKPKFFYHYISLLSSNLRLPTVELGCSLMEIIHGIELYNKFFEQYDISIQLNSFYGVEISELLRTAGIYINNIEETSIFTSVSSLNDFLNKSSTGMYIHDLGVGSYAFTDSQSYADFLNQFEAGSIKLFHNKQASDNIVEAGSKSLCIYSLDDLRSYLHKDLVYFSSEINLKERQYTGNDGSVSEIGHFIIGDSSKIMSTVERLRSINSVNNWFLESDFSPGIV